MKKSGLFGYVLCLVVGAAVGTFYVAPKMHDFKLSDLPSVPTALPSSLPTVPPSVKTALPKITWNAHQSTNSK